MKLNTKWAAAVAVALLIIAAASFKSAKGEQRMQTNHGAIILEGYQNSEVLNTNTGAFTSRYAGVILANATSSPGAPQFSNPIFSQVNDYEPTNAIQIVDALQTAFDSGFSLLRVDTPNSSSRFYVFVLTK